MNRPLIGIMTCHALQYLRKAQAQRQTWVRDVQAFADVKFFLGRGPTNCVGPCFDSDEVWLDVDDTYAGIPQKVQGIFRYGTAHAYPWTFKVDDDVFAIPARVRQFLENLKGCDYVGRFRGPCGNYPAHFASGFTYGLSLRAAEHVAKQAHNGDWMDERFVSNTLAFHGIQGHSAQDTFMVTGPYTRPELIGQRRALRDGTFYCQYAGPQMQELYELYGKLPYVPGTQKLWPVPHVKVTAAMLAAGPVDQIPKEKRDRYNQHG